MQVSQRCEGCPKKTTTSAVCLLSYTEYHESDGVDKCATTFKNKTLEQKLGKHF